MTTRHSPLTAQEALDSFGPIPTAATCEHRVGDVTTILRGRYVGKGMSVVVVSPCSLAELIRYYESCGWAVSDDVRRAEFHYRMVAE